MSRAGRSKFPSLFVTRAASSSFALAPLHPLFSFLYSGLLQITEKGKRESFGNQEGLTHRTQMVKTAKETQSLDEACRLEKAVGVSCWWVCNLCNAEDAMLCLPLFSLQGLAPEIYHIKTKIIRFCLMRETRKTFMQERVTWPAWRDFPAHYQLATAAPEKGYKEPLHCNRGHMLRDLHSCYIRLFDYNLILIVPLSVSKSDSFLVQFGWHKGA